MIVSTPHFERMILMSHNDCIRKSIDLKDRNITFDHLFCEELVIKGRRSKVYHAKLTYQPEKCKECKKRNTNHSIVKNGFMLSKIKWISHTRYPTYFFFKKTTFPMPSMWSEFPSGIIGIWKALFYCPEGETIRALWTHWRYFLQRYR